MPVLRPAHKGDPLIAIHDNKNSFSDGWIKYCDLNGIPYRRVDCYSSTVIDQLRGCDALMWHWSHDDRKAALFSRQLTLSLEQSGVPVFPSTSTAWHYDDKLGQKYLFEALDLPHARTFAFYDRDDALQWAAGTAYPFVFKLRAGAGSQNVTLVTTKRHAERLIRRAFGRGFKQASRAHLMAERLWHIRRDRSMTSIINLWRGIARLIVPTPYETTSPIERRYVLCQEFIPGCDHDIRVIIIGKRAIGIKRMVRAGDFRASGSGKLVHDPESIPLSAVKLAFEAAARLNSQSVALDFLIYGGRPLIVEISYAFPRGDFYGLCPGFWDDQLAWHSGRADPEGWMVEDLVKSLAPANPRFSR